MQIDRDTYPKGKFTPPRTRRQWREQEEHQRVHCECGYRGVSDDSGGCPRCDAGPGGKR